MTPLGGTELTVELHPPDEDSESPQEATKQGDFDERALRTVAEEGALTQRQLLKLLGGNRKAATDRLRVLVETGRLRTETGPRNATLYYLGGG